MLHLAILAKATYVAIPDEIKTKTAGRKFKDDYRKNIMVALIQRRADPAIQDKDGKTPLQLAISIACDKGVDALLETKNTEQVTRQNGSGHNAFMHVLTAANAGSSVCKIFDFGRENDILNLKTGELVAHRICGKAINVNPMNFCDGINLEHNQYLKILRECGSELGLNAKDEYGSTVFSMAVRDIMRLKEKSVGNCYDRWDVHKNIPENIEKFSMRLLSSLIDSGADVETDYEGRTPKDIVEDYKKTHRDEGVRELAEKIISLIEKNEVIIKPASRKGEKSTFSSACPKSPPRSTSLQTSSLSNSENTNGKSSPKVALRKNPDEGNGVQNDSIIQHSNSATLVSIKDLTSSNIGLFGGAVKKEPSSPSLPISPPSPK